MFARVSKSFIKLKKQLFVYDSVLHTCRIIALLWRKQGWCVFISKGSVSFNIPSPCHLLVGLCCSHFQGSRKLRQQRTCHLQGMVDKSDYLRLMPDAWHMCLLLYIFSCTCQQCIYQLIFFSGFMQHLLADSKAEAENVWICSNYFNFRFMAAAKVDVKAAWRRVIAH